MEILNRYKYQFTTLLLIGIITSLTLTRQPFQFIKVTLSKDSLPTIAVETAGKKENFELLLTSKFPAIISKEKYWDDMNVPLSQSQWKDLTGNTHDVAAIKINQLVVANFKLKNIQAALIDGGNDSAHSVRWPFSQSNLLLDIPHRKLLATNSLRRLKKEGYDVSKMEKITCKFADNLIYFQLDSESKPLSVAINTASPRSFARKEVTKTRFNTDYLQSLKLVPYDISPTYNADIFLGMDFFLRHIVYLDAKESVIYIGNKYPNRFINFSNKRIPIEYSKTGLPIITAKVQNNTIPVILDTGSCLEFSTHTRHFSTDSTKFLYNKTVLDCFGHPKHVEIYELPSIELLHHKMKRVLVGLEPDRDHSQSSIGLKMKSVGKIESKELAKIGHPILERENILFDFPNNSLYFVDTMHIHQTGFNLDEFECIPFAISNWGMIVKLDTELGPLKLVLDTGSSGTIVNTSHFKESLKELDECGNEVIHCKKFQLGSINFGPQKVYFYNLEAITGTDGVLGMSFLKNQTLYIDYSNKCLYIRKPIQLT